MRNDHDHDARDGDERIVHALRAIEALDPGGSLDDLRFERLARRINAAGAARLRLRAEPSRYAVIAGWARGLIPLGVAAAVAAALLLARGPINYGPGLGGGGSSGASAEPGLRVPDSGSLFAAAVGAVPEDDFLGSLWSRVDARSLLATGDRP